MNRPAFWLVLAACAAFILGAYLWFPAPTPAGQPPLARLNTQNVGEFALAFNSAPAGPRLVLLFSPT